MSIVSIPAHFDGKHVRLDRVASIPRNARLIVTVISDGDEERDEFLQLASQNLARAYDGDEVEYSLSDCVGE